MMRPKALIKRMLQPRIGVSIRPFICQKCLLSPSIPRRWVTFQGEPSSSARPETSETSNTRPPPPISATTKNEPFLLSFEPDGIEESTVLRKYKPRTPSIRHLRRPINDHLWRGRPHHPLTFPRRGQHIGGRNRSGRVVVRHRGGGHKRRIRVVDFVRMDSGKHTVQRIEYDPGRSAHIALLRKNNIVNGVEKGDGKLSYIVASMGMREGDVVESYRKGVPQELIDSLGGSADKGMIAAKTARRGNCLPLHMIPSGTIVYNVGLYPGKKAQLCRSAGTFAMVVNKNEDTAEGQRPSPFVDVRLKSGEVRRIHKDACATIGVASNAMWQKQQLGKAGRSRWLGIRPTVRGLAMNASDHPHGGGRGKGKGNNLSVSIWGTLVSFVMFYSDCSKGLTGV